MQKILVLYGDKDVAFVTVAHFVDEHLVLLDVGEFFHGFEDDEPLVVNVQRGEVIKLLVAVALLVVEDDDVVIFFQSRVGSELYFFLPLEEEDRVQKVLHKYATRKKVSCDKKEGDR